MSDAGAATVVGAAGGNGAVPWHQGFELHDYAANKGWAVADPAEAARAAIKAYGELERFRGVPGDEIARIPKDLNDPAMAALWQRLGAPKDASGYVFADVKQADGTAAPAEYVEAMRGLAVAHHLPATAAADIAAKAFALVEQGQIAVVTARANAEKAELDLEWGANGPRNLLLATRAVQAMPELGATSVDAFQGKVGYKAIMKTLAALGARMGEATTLQGQGTVGQGMADPATAEARLVELRKDRAFYVKMTDPKAEGHADAQKLWADLNRASQGPR